MSRPGWRQPVKIADAVSAALQRLGLEGRVRQHDIWRIWPLVVGPQIARHAQPYSVWQGRLIIHVTDSVWLHHLSMMRHRLVQALNEGLKPAEIREMVLRVGEVPVTTIGPSPRQIRSVATSGVDPARIAEIEDALAPLGDAPFREALRQLWLRASQESASSADAPRKRQPE
jgi:predicted nucleic acid-binding Zn ribbon protein